MLLGYELEWTRVMLVAVLGGLLGILMMIPLRRAFIVKQHGKLPYPEGTACAKVLIVGEHGGSNARTVFLGFGIGFVYQILMKGLKLWSGEWDRAITGIKGYTKAVVSLEPDPVLLGVGYIIGPRIASVMVGGGILTALMLTPMIAYFGDGLPGVLPPGPAEDQRDERGTDLEPVRALHRRGGGGRGRHPQHAQRPAADLRVDSGQLQRDGLEPESRSSRAATARSENGPGPGPIATSRCRWSLLGCLGLVAAIAASNLIPTDTIGRIIGGVMVVLFGFLFVTVSSRITGVIGSSSNPISGMTIATLLLTCLIFVAAGLGRDPSTAWRRCRSPAWSASPRPTAARPRRT